MPANIDTLTKVLNQAERAEPGSPEHEAFRARAVALSATLGVELAVARARQAASERVADPVEQAFTVGTPGPRNGPHNRLLVELFLACASVNDVQLTVSSDSTVVYGYGFPVDIEVLDRLYVLLEWEMMRAADEAIARKENVDPYGYRTDVRTFRNAFYDGFISRVRTRMYQSKRLAIQAAGGAEGSSGVELAIRDKEREIDKLKKEKNPHLALPSNRVTHWKPQKKDRSFWMRDAINSGSRAGDKVHIGTEPDLPAKPE